MENSKDEGCKAAVAFIEKTGMGATVGAEYNVEDSFSKMIGGVVRNGYGVVLGGVVAAVAERVAIACAQTIFGQHSHFCLGQISVSYLSSARPNDEVAVDASVIRRGREVTVVAVDFRLKESHRLAYVSRATLYKPPLSNL